MNTEAEERSRAFAELGLTMVATFVPFSRSRNAKLKPTFRDLQISWRVSLLRNGREFLSTDYTQGIGHVPGYTQGLRDSLYNFERMYRAVQENMHFYLDSTPFRTTKIPPPTVDDVLYSLVRDSDVIDYRGFEDWAENCGYETDSRKAETIYRACLDIGLKLRAAVGSKGLERLREVFQDY